MHAFIFRAGARFLIGSLVTLCCVPTVCALAIAMAQVLYEGRLGETQIRAGACIYR
jgi:hypothetical protein